MAELLPPARGIELRNIAIDEGVPVVTFLCDCATETEVVMEGLGTETVEFAFTCDGCRSSHWITVTADGVDHG